MTTPIAGQTIAVIRSHAELADAFRAIKDMLQLSDAFCDEIGGLSVGHTSKCLGPTRIKNIGPVPFDTFCELFAVEFRMVINYAAVQRMQERWERRNPERIKIENRKPSKELVARAKPLVLRDFSRMGNAARTLLLPREQRVKIAKKAARARARLPKSKRSEISTRGWETRRLREQQRAESALYSTE